jgi:flagellar biogenesis protein FliO
MVKYLYAKFVNFFIIKNIKKAMIGNNKYIAVINKVNSTVVISCVKKNVEAF